MAKTSGGKIQQMNNALGDCEERIGAIVTRIKLGIASFALPIVENFTGAFQELMDILGGVDTPEGGYKFFNSDEVNDLQLIGQNLSDIYTKLGEIFDFDGGSLSDLIGTQQFLSDLQSITNEIDYVISKLADLKQAWQTANEVRASLSLGGVPSITGNATGTNYFEGGLTHVNEVGGEIMNLPNGTQIIPHDISEKMASSGGNTVTVNMNVAGNVINNDEYANQIGSLIANRVTLALSNC